MADLAPIICLPDLEVPPRLGPPTVLAELQRLLDKLLHLPLPAASDDGADEPADCQGGDGGLDVCLTAVPLEPGESLGLVDIHPADLCLVVADRLLSDSGALSDLAAPLAERRADLVLLEDENGAIVAWAAGPRLTRFGLPDTVEPAQLIRVAARERTVVLTLPPSARHGRVEWSSHDTQWADGDSLAPDRQTAGSSWRAPCSGGLTG